MEQLARLVGIVRQLRGEGGCPWDREQDPHTMRPYLLEEAYEVLEAIGDPGALDRTALREELGDLLFVVLLLAQMGDDGGWFTLEDVAGDIADKMVVRHPHVFDPRGDGPVAADGALATWEARKAEAKRARGRLGGVPTSLPALLRAHRQGEKAAAVGFDWSDAGAVLDKVHEELAELEEAHEGGDPARVAAELGDVLMALASYGRHARAPAEDALQGANSRFARRFRAMELQAERDGVGLDTLDAAQLDALWEAAKAAESVDRG